MTAIGGFLAHLEVERRASGHTLGRVTRTALCRCGASGNKPYCDGSHVKIGFVAP